MRLVLFVATLAAGIGFSLVVYLYPEASARVIDSVPVKFILIILCWLVLTGIAFSIYFLYHLPHPRRLVANTWKLSVVMAVTSIAASYLGFPRLLEFTFDPQNNGSTFAAKWEAVETGSALTLVVSGAMVIVSAWLYFYLHQWEHKHGRLIV